jgi:CheY-like chemotaxis protein
VSDGIPSSTSDSEVAAPAGDVSPAEGAFATVRDVTNEIVRLVRATATNATDRLSLTAVVRSLVPELERMFEDRTVLTREVQELRTRCIEMDAQLAAREAGWRAERAALETDVACERDQAQMLAEDLERRRTDLDLLAARERRLREQMEAVAARATTDREETLRLAREMVQSAEEARFAVVEEMDTLRSALAAEQARLVEIQHERARATQGEAELEAELNSARQIIEQLETSRASAAAELARQRTTLLHTESELLSAQHEYQLAQVQIDKLCSAHDDMIEDRAQMGAKLHHAQERESRLRLRITGLEQRIRAACGDATAASAPEPVEVPDDGAASALAIELSRAEERMRALEQEIAAAKAGASAAAARIADLQAQARAAELARVAAVAEADALRTRVGAGEAAPNEIVSDADELVIEPVPFELEEYAAPLDSEPIVAPDDVLPDDVAIADRADVPTIAVLDAPEAWNALDACDARIVPLGADACDRVRELAPDACVVNLAAPDALATAVALRTAGLTVPFYACAIASNGERAWPLGPFDVVLRPVDPEIVRTQLASRAPAGANVIMVGSDSATQLPLRQGLLQAGMSVRTAWDRKQAGDLADAVHPDVVIVDLASDAAGGADLIVDLAKRDQPPLIVVVPGTAPQLAALATALAAHAGDHGTIDRAALVRNAATLIPTR